MNDENAEQLAALFGPPARHSEHQAGDTIRFMLRGQETEGLITYVAAAGDTTTGKHAPCTYVCAVDGELMPVFVYSNEVLHEK